MIIVLKIILALMALSTIFAGKFVATDFNKVRKSSGYDDLSIWEKIKFSSVFYFILMALSSLCVFLIYFVIIPIHLS